jgi:L-seryl-tRNA(Ser) seleniumtransferase
MMSAGDEKIIADKLYRVLSNPPKQEARAAAQPPGGNLTGRWEVQIQYAAGRSTHVLHLSQQGNQLSGAHDGEFSSRDIAGSINGNTVQLSSSLSGQRGDSVSYRFTGTLAENSISGTIDMGEYLNAQWTATRSQGRGGRGRGA